MKVLSDEGSTLLLTKSRTPSYGTCVLRNEGRRGYLRAPSRGTAVPIGAGSCHCASRYPEASKATTKRLFMETDGSSSRASVPNDLAGGVVGAGGPLRCRAFPNMASGLGTPKVATLAAEICGRAA
jgi:hypothetical protein